MEFSYKVFSQESDEMLAIADKKILGKKFHSKDIDIEISKNFYHQAFCNEKEIIKLIEKATIINAIGPDIIEFFVKKKIIDKKTIKNPCGIPHVQIVRLS